MVYSIITSNSQNTTFRLLSDNNTVTELVPIIKNNCSSSLGSGSPLPPTLYNDTLDTWPQPEQAIQYYRASSVALSLDGYNNTAALTVDGGPDVPLPTNIDTTLLNCLNQTIGTAVPLISNGALSWQSPPTIGVFSMFWLMAYFLHLF